MSTMTIVAPGRGSRAQAPRGKGARDSGISRTGAMLIMAVFTVYFLLPLWWLLVASSKETGDILTTAPLWFADFHLLDNIAELFAYRDGVYLRWLLNSVLYAALGGAIATLLAAMAGYALAKYRFPGRDLMFDIVLGGVLVPATALALPLFLIFSQAQLTNTFWSVFLPSIVSPFGVYLARIFAASSVPDELLEASRLDGAGEIRTFFTVSIRLMTPALVTMFLFQFVAIWNNFMLPYIMLGDDSLFPLTVGLNGLLNQGASAPALYTLVITGALLSVIPLIAIFLVLQRFWRVDLAAGAVK